ncbi:hypothetical protein ABT404_18740 [Streptomyces hyaluromycini]|uniref:FHA domain-containing protein n=1 Tax=Streptomyces hyaluromycini TaxID=1377993 RepID=A0ABV1WXH7_9ACTN
MQPGDILTFGRGAERDIRFAYDPQDDFVSRHAGSLIALKDGVLVRNDSRTQGLILQAFPGPEIPVGPHMAVGTMPYEQVRLVVPGRHGSRYALLLDTRGLRAQPRPAAGDGTVDTRPAGVVPTRAQATKITDRELRLLAALCEPLLLLAGEEAAAATYRQIADRVGGTPASVRTCLDALRSRLTDADGIPGLRNDDASAGARADAFGPALAQWALSSGTVTTGHLSLLPQSLLPQRRSSQSGPAAETQ